MTFKDLVAAAHPILFEVDSTDTPYAGQGTCFLAKSHGAYSLFSAQHVVDACAADTLRVFPNDESDVSIAFNRVTQVANPNPEDNDYADVICLRIDSSPFDTARGMVTSFIDVERPLAILEPGSKLIIAGYPDQFRGVDYETLKIRAIGQLLAAEYVGRSISAACHEIRFTDLGEVSNLSGFSGSPVFALTAFHKHSPHLGFAGMLLRGTAASRLGHVLDAKVVRRFARAANERMAARGQQA